MSQRSNPPCLAKMVRLIGGLVLSLGVAGGALARDADFEVIKRENVRVPMRDGVELATDLYLPGRDGEVVAGKFPVILSRTPYGRKSNVAQAYTPRGYVVVLQDTRGRGDSEGTWTWMSDDRQDGYDAVEWIAAQPWSDGKIGMMGCSYVGATQHLAAMTKPPHLTTIIPSNPSINHGVGGIIWDGAFRLRIVNWIVGNAAKGSERARDPAFREPLERQAKRAAYYVEHLPIRRGLTPLRMVPEYEDMLVEMLAHRRNDVFWRFSNIRDHADEHKDLPVFLVGGWYDLFSRSTTETYMALRDAGESPVHLIMGPWPHCSQKRSHAQVDFGAEAAADMRGFQLAWFDRWLKGKKEGFDTEAPFRTPVRAFVMGTGDGSRTEDGKLSHGGYWRDLADYPPPRAKATNFYLREGGELSTDPPDEANGSTTYEFDPRDPVPTIGGQIVGGNAGAWNQWGRPGLPNAEEPMPLSMRNDIVVFQTPPLDEDVEVIGPIEVKLWASSSAVDTDFTAKLIDAYPPSADFPEGFDLIMGDGIVRARYRESDHEERLMKPGTTYEFTVRLDPCSNVFKKGHRIRLDISSSNFPRFDVNPNSGEPANDFRRLVTAINTIHHDAEHPTRLVLPLMSDDKAAGGEVR